MFSFEFLAQQKGQQQKTSVAQRRKQRHLCCMVDGVDFFIHMFIIFVHCFLCQIFLHPTATIRMIMPFAIASLATYHRTISLLETSGVSLVLSSSATCTAERLTF